MFHVVSYVRWGFPQVLFGKKRILGYTEINLQLITYNTQPT